MSTGATEQSSHIEIGVVARSHGLTGAVQVRLHNPDSDALDRCDRLTLGGGERSFQRMGRTSAGAWIIQIEGVEGRDEADALRGSPILVSRDLVAPLDEDEYLFEDLVGCQVLDEEGEPLGEVVEVLDTGAAPVLDLRDGKKALMIPLADEWVTEIDLEQKTIHVTGGDQWRELATGG